MRQGPFHLTYCLNVHPGEAWCDNERAIREHARRVRERVGGAAPFGLGLRLSAAAAAALAAPGAMDALRDLLARQRMYVFTVNGFPYGAFHGTPVKEAVYAPDWRTDERLRYTLRLADLLGGLLPAGGEGSISTVPAGYKAAMGSEADDEQVARNLAACALALARRLAETGREIHVGLEPEPDCRIETADEAVAFFEEVVCRAGAAHAAAAGGVSRAQAEALLRRHIGVCVDACHAAVEFEDPGDVLTRLRAAGIRISKVQLSAALGGAAGPEAREALRGLCDPVYLHQVKFRDAAGRVRGVRDLDDALGDPVWDTGAAEWRVHVHVPLYFAGQGALGTTRDGLTPAFFARCARAVSHLEIETYTFHVLPEWARDADVAASIAREYEWVVPRMRGAGDVRADPGPAGRL